MFFYRGELMLLKVATLKGTLGAPANGVRLTGDRSPSKCNRDVLNVIKTIIEHIFTLINHREW